MSADFKLLPALFVHVRRTQNRVRIANRRQRDRTRYAGAGPLGRIDDFRRRLVKDPVVVGL